MASKIRVLTEHTINKIAAGEVIENPSSVVKELVENAIDAGSTEICVEIRGGGRQLVRVSDNGCGMNADDALLCLERHATSKIRELDDIYDLSTMGFRGEAIPSIASISKFTLLTCADENPEKGTMVIIDGGRIVQCCPAVRSKGTTMEVKALFFNVPVRKKFQKSPAYDANEILKMLSVLALGNPNIKFELISDQKNVLMAHAPTASDNTFLDTLSQRISDVLGSDFIAGTCPVEVTKGEYTLSGYIGAPSNHRQNRTGQYLFINKRGITSPLVSFAVREGYGTTLPTNRHPVFVLHLTMPGNLVDVNVHPQKREVKLRQELILKEMVVRAVEKALQEAGGVLSNTSESYSVPFFETSPAAFERRVDYSALPSPNMFEKHAFNIHFSDERPQDQREVYPTCISSPQQVRVVSEEPVLFSHLAPQKAPTVLAVIKRYVLLDPASVASPELNGMRDGICLLDQRAAHSRIIFEKLSDAHEAAKDLPVQALLIPYTLDMSPFEASVLRGNLEEFNGMGIQIEEFGQNTFIVSAIPELFGNADVPSLINEMVHNLRELGDGKALRREKERLIAMAAGRAAVSADRKLTLTEAQGLVSQLMECRMPYQCPQGKPTITHLASDELAKQFGRG